MVHTRKNVKIAVCVSLGIWLLIFLVTVSLHIRKQTIYLPCLAWGDVGGRQVNYFPSLDIGVFVFPTSLTASAYVLMLRMFQSSAMGEHSEKGEGHHIHCPYPAIYLICFTPSNFYLWHYFLTKSGGQTHVFVLYTVALCLPSKAALTLLSITLFLNFREHAKSALLCWRLRTVKRMQISLTSNSPGNPMLTLQVQPVLKPIKFTSSTDSFTEPCEACLPLWGGGCYFLTNQGLARVYAAYPRIAGDFLVCISLPHYHRYVSEFSYLDVSKTEPTEEDIAR